MHQREGFLAKWVRLMAVALVLGAAFLPVGSASNARARDADAPLDLAALVLRPDDLAAAGLDGFGVEAGQAFSSIGDALAAKPYAHSRGAIQFNRFQPAEQILKDSDWQRLYETRMVTTQKDDPTLYASEVASGIEVYGSAEGAAHAFADFSQHQALEAMIHGPIEELDRLTDFGDQTLMWRNPTTTLDSGLPLTSLFLWVLDDNLILGIDLVDYTGASEPDPEVAEQLMTTLVDRVETDADVPAPELSTRVLHLHGAGAFLSIDGYDRLNSAAVTFRGESPDDLRARQKRGDDQQLLNRWYSEEVIHGSPFGYGGNEYIFYDVVIDQFANEDAARAYMDQIEQRYLDSGFEDVNVTPGSTAFGDDVIDVTYTHEGAAETAVEVRIGALVANVALLGATSPLLDVAEQLAAS